VVKSWPNKRASAPELAMGCAADGRATLLTVAHDHDLVDHFARVIDFESFFAGGGA
jgi:hypothetical protein